MDGNKLVLHIDGDEVLVADGLTLPVIEDYVPCTEPVDYTFVVGRFGIPELTWSQEWEYNWWKSMELPRKEKKAYRKKLIKMINS